MYGLSEVTITLKESIIKPKQSQPQPEATPVCNNDDQNGQNENENEKETIKTALQGLPVTKDDVTEVSSDGSISSSADGTDAYVADTETRPQPSGSDGNNKPEQDQLKLEEYVPLKHLLSMAEEDRQLVELAHSWDPTSRGGKIEIFPNAPNLCIPSLKFDDRIQVSKTK